MSFSQPRDICIPARDYRFLETGVSVTLPADVSGLVMGTKNSFLAGLQVTTMVLEPGVTSHVRVMVTNNRKDKYFITKQDKLVQVFFQPHLPVQLVHSEWKTFDGEETSPPPSVKSSGESRQGEGRVKAWAKGKKGQGGVSFPNEEEGPGDLVKKMGGGRCKEGTRMRPFWTNSYNS